MVVFESKKEFYKVIVIKIDLMCSEVVDERHFPTLEKASDFVAMTDAPDRFCLTVKM